MAAAVPTPIAAAVPTPAAAAVPVDGSAAQAAARPVRPPLAGVLAGAGLAVLALPALAAAGSAPLPRLTALAGSLVAAAAAWAARRRGLQPVPVVVAGGVTVASVWLLSQARPGPVTLLLGLLLGFSLGAPLAGQPLAGAPTAAALAATAALAVTTAFDHAALFWLAGALGVTTNLGPLAAGRSLGRPVPASARRVVRRRVSWALTSVVVLTTGLTASWVGATSASADWFGTVISHGPRQVPQVAVTFDGVPDAETARVVLGALDAEGVRATFFAAGREVEARPDVVRALVGHDQLVANNAYAPRGGGAFLDPRYGELGRAQEVFGRELGVCPTYFRPPAGRHTPLMARVVHRYGMSMVTWDVRVADKRADSPRELARLALDRIRAGSIVVFPLDGNGHFARPVVEATLPLVLRGLKGLDLASVRLDRLLGADGYAGRCTRSA
jgi:peptidoglycan/xylan/chitin deacetylase (PgdA/CDA1 family)